eukprot:TRINITY_DN2160_c0_g1_i10.p1 TRINITY_DN2160_c0_g1~~TRINITY_DN2160_c0_g1_i10.p1  ORF type:complete len:192 (-),score=62.89 TRINITY_DN2160_c0_g1_i10:77-652(-)
MRRDRESFGFMTRGYKAHLYFWDVVTTVRKIIIVLISLFASAPLQLFFTTWILLLSWLAQHFFEPYETKEGASTSLAAKMESASLWVLLITVTIGALFFNGVLNPEGADGTAVSVLLIILNFAAVSVFLFLAVRKTVKNLNWRGSNGSVGSHVSQVVGWARGVGRRESKPADVATQDTGVPMHNLQFQAPA